MKKLFILAVGALTLLVGSACLQFSTPGARLPDDDLRSISVSGTGTTSVAPDILTANLGVEVQNDDLTAALDEATRRVNEVTARLRAAGIAAEDIRTLRFNINQVPRDLRNPASDQRTFQVSNILSVKIRNLDQAGGTISAATNAGANRVESINFGIDDPVAARTAARALAVERAAETARELAANANLALGNVVSISEGSGGAVPVQARGGVAQSAADVPLEPGQLQVSVTVSVRYAIQ